MANKTVHLKYVGSQDPYFETPITGGPQGWRKGQSSAVDASYVEAFLATGFFERAGELPLVAKGGLLADDSAASVILSRSSRSVFNLHAGSLPKWSVIRNAALSGSLTAATANAAIAVLGNSISAGAGAGTGGTTNMIGAKARSGTTKLAKALQSRGISARAGHFMSDQNAQSAASITYNNVVGTSYDPLLAYTGTSQWSQVTLGGVMIRLNATGEKISYTPPQTFDTVLMSYVRNAGLATVAVDVDGGTALDTFSANGSPAGIVSRTITGITEGVHTFNITATTTAQFYLRSLRFQSSTRPAIDVLNYGWWGGVVNDFLGTSLGWSPGNVLSQNVDGVSLVIVKLTTNDINGATTLATFTANLTSLITRIQTGGADVMLVTDEPFSGTNAINGKSATFIAAMKTLALQFDIPMIDLFSRYGPAYEAAPGRYFDSLHPAEVTQEDSSNFIADVLLVA